MQVYDIILILFVSSSNTNRYPHFVLLIVNTLSCGKITTTLELSSTLPNTLIKKKKKKKHCYGFCGCASIVTNSHNE